MHATIEDPGFKAPVKTWLPVEEIEPAAMEQLHNAARHPEAGTHIAVMPDCHVGYGVTIGCVFPTLNSVLPNAVGVDIGCGMAAVRTDITLDRERMDRLFWRNWSGQVQRNVPTGFGIHKRPQDLGDLDRELKAAELQPLIRERASVQLGTLGGGNHFLEAQVDDEDIVWLMVHSGSRHTGLRIANHYNQLAMEVTEQRGLAVGKDLASLPIDDQTGMDYLHDAQWATEFARENRFRMLDAMVREFFRAVERLGLGQLSTVDPGSLTPINIHHNFAQLEEHDGVSQMVHRKGATSAFEGQLGIIPGSMGAPSFIVRGKGNLDSLQSCSHGAGRRMGRAVAKKTITDAEFSASIAGTFSKASRSYIDEAPGVYKDIATVISRQSDLIEIVHTLTPIITLKGDSRAKED